MNNDTLKQQIRRHQISDILLLAIVALAIFAFFCCIFSANAQEAKKPPMPDTIKQALVKKEIAITERKTMAKRDVIESRIIVGTDIHSTTASGKLIITPLQKLNTARVTSSPGSLAAPAQPTKKGKTP